MVDAACSRGIANVTVADVVERAGVSRRTFYELFADADECLRAAIEQGLEHASSYVCEAYDPRAAWRVRVRSGLEALLSFLDDEPSMGKLLVVDLLLPSRASALARRAAALTRAIGEIDSARTHGRDGALSLLTAEGMVGAVIWIVHSRLTVEPRRPLLELASPLMAMIVLPYLGPAAARRELSQPAPKRGRRDRPASASHEQLNGLPMRVTYRTAVVLDAIASHPGASNRQVGSLAGVSDQGQISKLLRRLAGLGLIEKADTTVPGVLNAWTLTPRGSEVQQALGPLGVTNAEASVG